jgi:hypothetical protein
MIYYGGYDMTLQTNNLNLGVDTKENQQLSVSKCTKMQRNTQPPRNLEEDVNDPLCWRCGEPDSEHSWHAGVTYCLPEPGEDVDEYLGMRYVFQPDPPYIDDEELIRRETFLRDVRDWVL